MEPYQYFIALIMDEKAQVAIIALMALALLDVLFGVVGPVWGMPHVDAIVTTINATGLLIGALIGASAITAKG